MVMMYMLQYDINKVYNNFINTFRHCGNFLINETDDAIMHHLFEEFSIDVVSFFHEKTLKVLLEESLINEEIYFECLEIRASYLDIEMNNRQLMNPKSVRESDKWKSLFDLSDKTYLNTLQISHHSNYKSGVQVLSNICLYGEVLYKSMCYIKGKCSNKGMGRKFLNELTDYIDLWNLCMVLLLDEIFNKTEKIDFLIKYLNESNKTFVDMNIDFEHRCDLCLYTSIPTDAIELMINCILEINIDICDYKRNYKKINNYLFALHNLPRCLLNPQQKEYISQKEAIAYSLSYLNKDKIN